MKGKRTGIDFSKHEVIIKQADGFLEHYLRKPNTVTDAIRYINAGGILAVTGDYGNWIFCREFHPSQEGGVSDGYWEEKLQIASTQQHEEYDADATEQRLKELIDIGLEEQGYEGERLAKMKEFYTECLEMVHENEFHYMSHVVDCAPTFCDCDDYILIKKTKYWLLAVFDGFDEICRRLKSGELTEPKKATT